MQAKEVLYAAVGAPVVAARKVGEQMSALRDRVSKETGTYAEAATRAIDEWAAEGEKLMTRITEGKMVEEISQKVDLDQAKEQVGKLRDQLEDMLSTWRSSFRPEKAEKPGESAPAAQTATTPRSESAPKTPAPKGSTAKSAAKKPASKTSAAKTTKSSQAAKKSSAKSTSTRSKAS